MAQIILISAFSILVSFAGVGCASSATQNEAGAAAKPALVLMTDFGLRDGAVSAMKGVAQQTAAGVLVSDLTHEIPSYSIWDAAFRLQQTYKYWPTGTVFVTVIDPGVGSERKSIALKTKSGHFFIGPDNGLTTLVADEAGIESVQQIDETRQRLKGSEDSYTFHGRDLYVYVGARLAGGLVRFEDLGSQGDGSNLVRIDYQKAEFVEADSTIAGGIPVLDPQFGNVWTNVPKSLVESKLLMGPDSKYRVQIFKRPASQPIPKVLPPKSVGKSASPKLKPVFDQILPLGATFAAVPKGRPLLYFNSLLNVSLAINQGDFAKRFGISSGPEWTVLISPHRISR